MIVAFRVDASTQIGSGHVMRCLALADALRARGADVVFICREHEGHLFARIAARDFPVITLPPPNRHAEATLDLLGVTEHQDAAETLDRLPVGVDWLIVDHYGLSRAWESAARTGERHIVVLDDLADRDHDCDVLIDPTFPGDPGRYRARAGSAQLLLGPSFALMDPEYARSRKLAGDRPKQERRLLIFFGGSDLPDLTSRTLVAISTGPLRSLPADVVVGATNPYRLKIERIAADRPGTTIHGYQPHLADLMRSCTVAVGAGGVTAWERLCIGLPSVVVSLADNQVESSRAMASAGLITYVGTSEEVTDADLRRALESLLHAPESLIETARRGQAFVDGLGSRRVAEVIIPTDPAHLIVRPAMSSDMGQLFVWANDAEVRRAALTPHEITWAEHTSWFNGRLTNPSCQMYILQAAGLPVGQVRFDIEGATAILDYSIDPTFRGRGWGSTMVMMATTELLAQRDIEVIANVRPENSASMAALRRAGFRLSALDAGEADVICLRLHRGDDGITDDGDLIIRKSREDGK